MADDSAPDRWIEPKVHGPYPFGNPPGTHHLQTEGAADEKPAPMPIRSLPNTVRKAAHKAGVILTSEALSQYTIEERTCAGCSHVRKVRVYHFHQPNGEPYHVPLWSRTCYSCYLNKRAESYERAAKLCRQKAERIVRARAQHAAAPPDPTADPETLNQELQELIEAVT